MNNLATILLAALFFCNSLCTQGAETEAALPPANIVSNLPPGTPQSHTVRAAPVPPTEPVIETPTFSPTNGPSLTDLGELAKRAESLDG